MPRGKPKYLHDPVHRFWSKVIIPADPEACWGWRGTVKKQDGYAVFWFNGQNRFAARFMWELINGPMPEGYEPDHLCRNRTCTRPDHLEQVTGKVNTLRGTSPWADNARKTHCPNGHPYDNVNKKGRRTCSECARLRANARYAKAHPDAKPAQALRTHCPMGHAYDEQNTKIKGGSRYCKACLREKAKEAYQRRRYGTTVVKSLPPMRPAMGGLQAVRQLYAGRA